MNEKLDSVIGAIEEACRSEAVLCGMKFDEISDASDLVCSCTPQDVHLIASY